MEMKLMSSVKGQTLPGKLFNMLIVLAIGSAIVIVVFFVTRYAGIAHRYDTTVRILYTPTKYDIALMVFLESTDPDTGIPMKDIIASAVAQKSDSYVYVDGNSINIQSVTGPLLAGILEKPFFLRATSPELKLGGSATSLGKSVYKTSTQLFKPDGSACQLELYVG